MNYRITKYDPKKRNNQGHYLDNSEWTSISDIGKPEYKNISYLDYEKTESAYIKSIQIILHEFKIQNLEINNLELHNDVKDFQEFKENGRLRNIEINFKNEIKNLKNGTFLNVDEISKISQLILRETIWMNLSNSDLKITFGYDYYMYFECTTLSQSTITQIENLGLYVEL
jgi:hypothetical protein